MENRKRKKIALLFVLIITIICFFIGYNEYEKEKTIIRDSLHYSFKYSIAIDREERIGSTNVNFLDQESSLESDSLIFYYNDHRINILRKDSTKKLSQLEKLENIYQTYLYFGNPLNVTVLDSFFRAELMRKDIYVKTHLKYIDNLSGKMFWSNADSLFDKSMQPLDSVTLGIRDEITLKTYAEITLLSIVRKAKWKLIIICFIWLILLVLTLLLLYIVPYRKKTADVTSFVEELNKRVRYNVSKRIYLDSDKLMLISDEQEIQLTNQLVQLMELFLNSPDNFVSYEVLVPALYGNIDDPKDRISQTVKRLRRLLVHFPELEIKNIPNKGYQLVINDSL